MKNLNKISYLEIKNCFEKNKLYFSSKLSDDDFFLALKSIYIAGSNDLTFFSNNSSITLLKNLRAKACLINKKYIDMVPKNTVSIIVDDPYKAFAIVSNLFSNEDLSNGEISKNTLINANTKIHDNVQIDSFVNIKENCTIDKNVIIESNCTIGPNVTISENTIIRSNSRLLNCVIGKNCIIKDGAVIGGAGFGFDPISKNRIQHLGNVVIKDNCNIGSNTTIDRAVFESTIIEDNCFIDNLVQIAHNVKIGKGSIIAAQSGIAGSATLGENVTIGGQSGVAGHISIGNNVIIAAKSGVTKNIKNNSTVAGYPAIDIKKWKIKNIKLNKL